MDAAKAAEHITLGGTVEEFIALYGSLTVDEIAEFKQLAKEIAAAKSNRQVVWIPSDF